MRFLRWWRQLLVSLLYSNYDSRSHDVARVDHFLPCLLPSDFTVMTLTMLCFSPAPHREAGGCCARHSGAGDAELNAAECRRTDCEFTFMVLVIASVLRCGMLLNMVQPIPHFVLSNLYHHPQTPYLISGPGVGTSSAGYVPDSPAPPPHPSSPSPGELVTAAGWRDAYHLSRAPVGHPL